MVLVCLSGILPVTVAEHRKSLDDLTHRKLQAIKMKALENLLFKRRVQAGEMAQLVKALVAKMAARVQKSRYYTHTHVIII